jgi:aromatic ring-opening dioxygenase LigB subunit
MHIAVPPSMVYPISSVLINMTNRAGEVHVFLDSQKSKFTMTIINILLNLSIKIVLDIASRVRDNAHECRHLHLLVYARLHNSCSHRVRVIEDNIIVLISMFFLTLCLFQC